MSIKSNENILVPHNILRDKFYGILKVRGFKSKEAVIISSVFMESSLEGVYSHGVNRFPKFIEFVDNGYVKLEGKLTNSSGIGGLEQWDGGLRAGILNALDCTERVTALAAENGIGCVALSNTNHWMRGGTYGWKVAKAGFLFIGWTNTLANMPAWGAVNSKLGNNPLVLAVPFNDEAIVLDMAMSQFSYGALEKYALNKAELPVAGGYDKSGKITRDPEDIMDSKRIMPAGYWKGAGLSLLLDIFSTILTGGLSTCELSEKEVEYGLSQVFIALDIKKLPNFPLINDTVNAIIDDYKTSAPSEGAEKIVYPGENIVTTRNKNLSKGIPVNISVWKTIEKL